ncbi:MAG: adenylosuccinate lyase, partial [Euryarchaeota archaeon]|nr:adenylosuccinate lyase [Euryarchaeota archaeon]
PIDYRYGSPEMRRVFEEEARLQRLLEVEAALAKAHAELGNIPKEAAEEIARKASTEHVKLERVKEIEAETKHDLMAVVKALAERCGEAGRYVHLGATSYDIVDTANALQFRDALVEADLYELEGILLELAEKHKSTVAIGRTHGQHALPITYGLKFAIWARELRRHLQRLQEAKKRVLVGKMSGAVGTMAGFGRRGIELQERVMRMLGLRAPLVSSQVVQRDRYAELLSLLALIAATLDKMAKEVRNLMRTEIAELREPFAEKQVGSSTMPHKRNPVNAENICGLARVVKSNVFVALENVALEHERDLTNSSAERVIIPESFMLVDEMLKRAKKIFSNLEIDMKNVRKNLELTRGMNLAEAVMLRLTERGMSRQEAHELLRRLAMKAWEEERSFEDVLIESEEVTRLLSPSEIKEALKPENYIGLAVELVERAVEQAKRERSQSNIN